MLLLQCIGQAIILDLCCRVTSLCLWVCAFTCVVITVDCDCDIEEHFKRSLGRDYCNYLNQSAPCNGAVTFSSAAAAPCSGAMTTIISSSGVTSHTTLSDLLSADAKIHDNGSEASKKCSAISVTGITTVTGTHCDYPRRHGQAE